jgi:MFS family permease
MNNQFSKFWIFIAGRLFFTLAVNMQGTLLAWFIYELTRDALYLGLTGLAEIIPFILTLFPGGAAADRYHRKRIIMISMLAFLAINLGFCWYSFQIAGNGMIWPLYFLIGLTGIARGYLSPAQNAILGQLVERTKLTRAATWNSAVFQTGQVLGPAIAGILYGMLGPRISFLCVAGLIAVAILFIGMLRDIPKPAAQIMAEPWLKRIKSGVEFVRNHKLLFPAMFLDMVAVLFGGAVAVLPLFADQVLHTGPEGLGWLRAAPALGSVLSSLLLIRFSPGKGAGMRMLWAVAGFGLCNLLFALSSNLSISICLLFLAGMCDSYSMVIRGALLQICTPDEMKGRVSAVNSVFIGSSNELGAFESGLAARFLGLVPSVVCGSLITFATVGTAKLRAPELANLDLSKNNL